MLVWNNFLHSFTNKNIIWFPLINKYILFESFPVWALFLEGWIFYFILYISSWTWFIIWACYLQPQTRVVWCSGAYTSCKECSNSAWFGGNPANWDRRCHAFATISGSGRSVMGFCHSFFRVHVWHFLFKDKIRRLDSYGHVEHPKSCVW